MCPFKPGGLRREQEKECYLLLFLSTHPCASFNSLWLCVSSGDGSRLSLKQLLHQGSGSEELASLVLAVKMGGCPWAILDTDELKVSTDTGA